MLRDPVRETEVAYHRREVGRPLIVVALGLRTRTTKQSLLGCRHSGSGQGSSRRVTVDTIHKMMSHQIESWEWRMSRIR